MGGLGPELWDLIVRPLEDAAADGIGAKLRYTLTPPSPPFLPFRYVLDPPPPLEDTWGPFSCGFYSRRGGLPPLLSTTTI